MDAIIQFFNKNINNIILIVFLIISTLLFMYFVIKMDKRISIKEEERKEKVKLKKDKQESLEYKFVNRNNKTLKDITRSRIIIIKGLAGKGKTLFMQVITKFLVDVFDFDFNKHRRRNMIMNPDFVERRLKLKQDGFLPVYSTLDYVEDPISKLRAFDKQTTLDVIRQRKLANAPFVLQVDEFSSLFPKKQIYQNAAEKDKDKLQDIEEIKETARKIRHMGGWLIGTEQDGDDIVKDIRQFGYALVTAHDTFVFLMKRGRLLLSLKLFAQKWMPGWFVSKLGRNLKQQLFIKDKIFTFIKYIMPGFWANEKQYYINTDLIYKDIKQEYTLFKLLLEFEGKKKWLWFTHSQKLIYDTLAYKDDYLAKFDLTTGERKNA